jgi:hypothetical protein
MLFIQTLFAGAAFIVAAVALEINEFPRTVEAGKTYTVKYSPADDTPTTFILRQGANEDLKTVSILTSTFSPPEEHVTSEEYIQSNFSHEASRLSWHCKVVSGDHNTTCDASLSLMPIY